MQLTKSRESTDVNAEFSELCRCQNGLKLTVVVNEGDIALPDLLIIDPNGYRIRARLLPSNLHKIVEIGRLLLGVANLQRGRVKIVIGMCQTMVTKGKKHRRHCNQHDPCTGIRMRKCRWSPS